MQHAVRKAQAGQIGPRDLANVAHRAAHCGLGERLSSLFPSLATATELRLSEFNVQDVANIAWAFATVKQGNEKLLATLGAAVEWRQSEHKAQDVASTA